MPSTRTVLLVVAHSRSDRWPTTELYKRHFLGVLHMVSGKGCGKGFGKPHKLLAARFVCDVSIFDGTQMAPATKFTGHQHLDVPAGQARAFKLGFYAYKEGTYSAEVHFINDKTGEYLFYKLDLKAEPAGVLDSIALQAPLRQLTSHLLPVSNPLATAVTFTAAVSRRRHFSRRHNSNATTTSCASFT